MFNGVLVIVFTSILAFMMLNLNNKLSASEKRMLQNLFFYHLFFGFVYYVYAQFNPSDSDNYFKNPYFDYRGLDWLDYYGTGTEFVEFVAWPFIKIFGFSYEGMMALFCFIGYLGFYYSYLLFKERIKFKHKFFGFDLVILILFLPNMHFWTASLGKGSFMFCGVSVFVWALNDFRNRLLPLIIGAAMIYGVRVPILLVLVIGASIGMLMSSKGLSSTQKAFGIVASLAGLVYVLQSTSSFLQLDQINDVVGYFDNRGQKLSRSAGSGVNISQYNNLQKVLTFIYRPLFFDGRNAMGLVVSVENLFYVLLTLRLVNFKSIRFLWRSDYMVKMAFIAFLGASFALAQISGNLGIAIRQKSQVMYLFLFVVLEYLDQEKMKQYINYRKQKLKKIKEEQLKNAA